MARTEQDYIKLLGCIPDSPDKRDWKYTIPKHLVGATLPSSIDLRGACPKIGDQGNLGSCTAFAIAAAARYINIQIGQDFDPSELFLYYIERVVEGTVNRDNGAMIRTGMKCLNQQGVSEEYVWPYTISKYKTKPTTQAYQNALKHKATAYYRLDQNLTTMKSCLASGYPFVFGFTVYKSFVSNTVASTGTVPMPKPGEAILGGHAVLAVGYDDSIQRFICRNSWGTGWGVAGYFTMPYAYLTNINLSTDFWYVKGMTFLKSGKIAYKVVNPPLTVPTTPVKQPVVNK